jgi:hypothetical protein
MVRPPSLPSSVLTANIFLTDLESDEEYEYEGYEAMDMDSFNEFEEKLIQVEFPNILTTNVPVVKHCCRTPYFHNVVLNLEEVYSLFTELKENILTYDFECFLNQFKDASMAALDLGFEESIQPLKMNIIDIFLKLRHDFAVILIQDILNIPRQQSDVSFDTFGDITSNRTPDIIIKQGLHYFIMEVTVVSDSERAKIAKGDPRFGYESKYQKEINQLEGLKYFVHYYPIIINSSNLLEKDYKNILNEYFVFLNIDLTTVNYYNLETYRSELVTYSPSLIAVYSFYLTHLFKGSANFDIQESVNKLKPLFQKKHQRLYYKRVIIRADFYNKWFIDFVQLTKSLNVYIESLDYLEGTKKILGLYNVHEASFKFIDDQRGKDCYYWNKKLFEKSILSLSRLILCKEVEKEYLLNNSPNGIEFYKLSKSGLVNNVKNRFKLISKRPYNLH